MDYFSSIRFDSIIIKPSNIFDNDRKIWILLNIFDNIQIIIEYIWILLNIFDNFTEYIGPFFDHFQQFFDHFSIYSIMRSHYRIESIRWQPSLSKLSITIIIEILQIFPNIQNFDSITHVLIVNETCWLSCLITKMTRPPKWRSR